MSLGCVRCIVDSHVVAFDENLKNEIFFLRFENSKYLTATVL
jgi:hypothetical protein